MTAESGKLIKHPRIASARDCLRHVFVRDMVVNCSIGVHRHERDGRQRVRLNLDLAVSEGSESLDDRLENVVCYETIVHGIHELIERGHVSLVETLADDIATLCLADRRVRSARVRVEKLDVLMNAESVGVEIERFNSEV